jgi:hypothetical protein
MCLRNCRWTWIFAAVTAAVFSLGKSASPAGAQPLAVDPGKSSSSSSVVSSSSGPTYPVFLPLVQSGVAPTVFGVQIYSNPSKNALPLAEQAHVAWMRWPVYWSGIEPANTTPAQYRFSGLDLGAQCCPGAGVNLLMTTRGTLVGRQYPGGPLDKVTSVSWLNSWAPGRAA